MKTTSINLLASTKGKTLDRFINWSVTIGRILVIVTELIALGAFLYRFSLDAQIIDLKDSIRQKGKIVANYKNQEAKYRNLQDRLLISSSLIKQSTKIPKILEDITKILPNEISIKSIAIENNQVTLSLDVKSINSLSSFIDDLKKDKLTESIILNNIENKTSSGSIFVSMLITMKGN